MAKKTVSRRPQKVDIEEVINRGGTSPGGINGAGEQKDKVFNVRVPPALVEQVDILRRQRTGKVSRNTWILEAIEEKIAQESARVDGREGDI